MEIRFKLLALVPSVAGIAIGVLSSTSVGRAEEALLATLGFLVTLGIVIYDQRNTQFYNNAHGRVKWLEGELHFESAAGDPEDKNGLIRSFAPNGRRLFGLFQMRHDRGLALIYGGVLGGWVLPLAQAVAPGQLRIGVAVAALVGGLFFVELDRLGR
jgi:hypothetical protein